MGELGVLLLVVALVVVMMLLRWNMVVASRRRRQDGWSGRTERTGEDRWLDRHPVGVVAALLVLAVTGLAVAAYRLAT